MATVQLQDVCKRYGGAGGLTAVQDVSLTVADGEFMVLLGPSGCGKSTTLRMIAGLESISDGRLAIDGRAMNTVPAKDRDIAMVFQSYALYPHMTVADNLSFGLKRRGTPRAEIERRVTATAAMLGLTEYLARRPAALSGGQRQRVALGRAIVREPKVFLFDEPLSNLDAALRVATRNELTRLHRRLGATMIYVTHDQVEAMTMGSRICVMNRGRIAQVGAPLDVYRNPADTFVARFLGSPPMNLLPARLRRAAAGTVALVAGAEIPLTRWSDAALAGIAEASFGIRPEDMVLLPSDAGPQPFISGTVASVEPLGAETLLLVDTEGGETTARLHRDTAACPGDAVRLGIPTAAAYLFGSDGRAIAADRAVN
ncbi:sn-glycerol-3-phosphate ABC transporter ATP-binding protein UgpC [Roseomonas sp. KE2513]|uniref:ABC transporter ATP-binding protein n=1 Tax=Roseomonas sp. KE2513 TaxID=2479202 RepID=UPI0018DFC1CE|nr:sn-glycerol-3-phosphate ABC transporter ATP-binding protein UgpC [Roseomonas sp. KE2513]MBI0538604.1 sn-glycerol-3-phosphate ABC transporter ATP-binding protein UgpC [Roseomonas sp. KE2513]